MWMLALAACSGVADTGHDHSSHDHVTYTTIAATDGGSFLVEYVADPTPIPADDYFSVTATVYAASDADVPLLDVSVAVDADMPSHGHGMNVTPEVADGGDGSHTASPLLFHMSGDWRLRFAVTQGDLTEVAEMYVDCCE